MSYLAFAPSSTPPRASAGSLGSAYKQYLLANHGGGYRAAIQSQRARPEARRLNAAFAASSPGVTSPLVGIVGGGFAGLFAGLMLQSLGVEFDVFESSDRVGGRIRTWYSTDYSSQDVNKSGLYGEVGGMRLPQFSEDMLPVQQLALSVNAVLERNNLTDQKVFWRKFYYNSPVQRLRYNNMSSFITAENSGLASLNFDVARGGDIPEVWFTPATNSQGQAYLPINMVLDKVNKPFLDAFDASFATGFELLMQYDQYSMWDYLTNVFTLGDLGEFYTPAMGAKSDLLPWSIASFLETTNVGTGMYTVSFVEMVIAVYDWGGSNDPYRPGDTGVYMLTVDQGMQRFPDACRTVLELAEGVRPEDGQLAQVQIGMLPSSPDGAYSYTAPNLTPDAQPPGAMGAPPTAKQAEATSPPATPTRQRVFLEHKVVSLVHDRALYDGHGGMKVKVRPLGQAGAEPAPLVEKQYPYVITTLPNGAYLNGEFGENFLNDISFAKAQALRESDFMPAFKGFLTFTSQFWATLGERQDEGLGAAATDRPNRQIIYPSYGYAADQGVLQIYCWAQDARRLGALSDEERVAECLKGIAYLYPDTDVYGLFAGYDDGRTTKTWFWDEHAGGGAFALFNPGQYKNIYPTLLTPEFDGCLNFAGECCSVHHGWIVGALDSAYNAVYNILMQAGAHDKIEQLQQTWGGFVAPDVAPDAATVSQMDYTFLYSEIDRKAASIAPGLTQSIYGDSPFEFTGNVPAFVADYSKAPQSMKATAQDKAVLKMLNQLWDDNVAQRAKVRRSQVNQAPAPAPQTAVELLESIYYGDNFQTIPAPTHWLKDDDEFARQQLAGFMPNLLTKVSPDQVKALVDTAGIPNIERLGLIEAVTYVADYRQYLEACTVIPEGFYLAKPLVFFGLDGAGELTPLAIQLDVGGELFTPDMANADNAWLLAKMQTNCAGQTLHDVGFHQLLAHQICAMVSIALFSEEVFNPLTAPGGGPLFQRHPVFKLLSPHVSKVLEFQQTIYNGDFVPGLPPFPATREVSGAPGVYNIGFVYDLIFSCGRIGNYQLQDKIYNNDGAFRFLDLALPIDAARRGVLETEFSYPYVHDALLWHQAIAAFVGGFVNTVYPEGDASIAADVQLQRFFGKLIPAFNYVDGVTTAQRFPDAVVTSARLKEVLTMFVWQFSVQHTVVNDGAYNQAAFVPNASTLMFAPPADKASEAWTPEDVLACLPSQTATYPQLGGMTFTDVQINASVTGQGPYPETILGRGVVAPSIDVLQDTYAFVEPALRTLVDAFYQDAREVGDAIQLRQARDVARYMTANPRTTSVPVTVVFDRITPTTVMNTIQT